jgi:hypothetical protein
MLFFQSHPNLSTMSTIPFKNPCGGSDKPTPLFKIGSSFLSTITGFSTSSRPLSCYIVNIYINTYLCIYIRTSLKAEPMSHSSVCMCMPHACYTDTLPLELLHQHSLESKHLTLCLAYNRRSIWKVHYLWKVLVHSLFSSKVVYKNIKDRPFYSIKRYYRKFNLFNFYFASTLFLYWDLNSEPHGCKVGTLPLKPHPQAHLSFL